MQSESYFPQIFLPQNLAHAKEIILSSDPSGEKWARQTEDSAQAIVRSFAAAGARLFDQSIVLDYGCGIGRVSKRLIELTGCTVLGADISPGMLHMSMPYVNSERFIPCPQMQLAALVRGGLRVDGAVSIWTLQHCERPAEDIAKIHSSLKPGGLLFLVNKFARYMPVTPVGGYARWHDDRFDVLRGVEEKFEFVESVASPETTEEDYCKLYRKRYS